MNTFYTIMIWLTSLNYFYYLSKHTSYDLYFYIALGSIWTLGVGVVSGLRLANAKEEILKEEYDAFFDEAMKNRKDK